MVCGVAAMSIDVGARGEGTTAIGSPAFWSEVSVKLSQLSIREGLDTANVR